MSSTIQRLTTTLVDYGPKVVILLPFDANEIWGTKLRHYVTGTVNLIPVRGQLYFDEGQYYLTLGAAWRRDSGLDAGSVVDVVLAPEGPQLDTMSSDVVAALVAEPQAREFFESLATFYRKGYLKWIDGARKAETRTERINEMVQLLLAGEKQRPV